jgi:hypothetical protein
MSRPPQTTIRLLGALALILLAVLGSGLAAPVLVAVAAGIIILLVGLDISWRLRTPLPDNSI